MTKTKIALSSVAVMLAGVSAFLVSTKDVGKVEKPPNRANATNKWVNIPPALRTTTNLEVQKSLARIQSNAALVPVTYTNKPPAYFALWWDQRDNNGEVMTLPYINAKGKMAMYQVLRSTNLVNWSVFATTNKPPVRVPNNYANQFWRVTNFFQ